MASYDYLFFVPLMALTTVYKLGNTWRQRRGFLLLLTVFVGGTIAVVLKTVLVIWAIGLTNSERLRLPVPRARHDEAQRGLQGWVRTHSARPLLAVLRAIHLRRARGNVVSMVERFRRRPNPLTASSPLLVLVAGAAFVAIFSQLF